MVAGEPKVLLGGPGAVRPDVDLPRPSRPFLLKRKNLGTPPMQQLDVRYKQWRFGEQLDRRMFGHVGRSQQEAVGR